MKHLSFELFNSVFRYEKGTGGLYWKSRVPREGKQLAHLDKAWNVRYQDKPIARRVHRHGHLYVGHRGKNYAVHRLVWLLHYGHEPDGGIDHINGDPADNRIENLRIANQSQNLQNASIRSDNTSGVRGVSWSKRYQKWYVYINKNKKMHPLGLTSSFDEARAIRKAAEVEFFGEFARAA